MGTKAFWKAAIFAVLIFCVLQSTARADDLKAGQRPGKNDPLSRTTLFQDDELLVLGGYHGDYGTGLIEYYLYPLTGLGLEHWYQDWVGGDDEFQWFTTDFAASSKFRHMAAASGRLVDSKRDAAAYAAFRPDGKVQVELWDVQSGRHASVKTLDGSTASERSVDVAVGDLTKAVDDNGMYHDEIVVARTYQSADGKSGFAIDVLDKDLNTIGSDMFYSSALQSLVAVAIGDFDGDGYLEVAAGMTTHTSPTGVQVRLYRFARNQDGSLVMPLQFQHVSDYSSPAEAAPYRCFDMTAGDFDGDGKDEIYFVTTTRLDNPIIPQTGLNHSILRADQDLKLTRIYYNLDTPAEFIVLGQLRTQSGLFKFDPPNGWTLNRRQVVTCFIGGDPFYDGRGPNNQIWCEFYGFSANPTGGFDRVSTTERSVGAYLKGTTFYTDIDLAVGNYIGHGDLKNQTSPLMYPVVAYSESRPGHPYVKYTGAKVFAIPGQTSFVAGDVFSHVPASNGSGTEPIMPVVATALDGDGDTWRLGPPMHLTIENLINLDYIIQEPPKHVDYLPRNPGDPNSEWNVVNVSSKSDFNVEFGGTQETTVTSNSTDTSSHSIGGSAELDVKKTFSVGIPVISKVDTTVDVDTKLSYDYESKKSSWNSGYQQRTTSFTSKTERDDLVSGKMQLFDIWRYPVIGYYTSDPKPYRMYEVILPGPKLSFSAGGLDLADWYQPTHQNHNILSYPWVRAAGPFPPDVGEYELPDKTKIKGKTMNPLPMVQYFSGTSGTLSISWSEETGSGKETSYDKTLSESVDVKIGVESKGIFSAGASFQGSVNFNNSNSWGGSKTSSTTNSASKGVTLNLPSGDGNHAYAFEPAFYVSSGGGMFKVAHAVDPLGSAQGREWWTQQYGNKPDPALNLPNRFRWNPPSGNELEEYWTLIENDNRMEMRGFFLRHATQDPVSGQYELIDPGSLTDGDTVQLCARVYNFSLAIPTGPFRVLFEYVPVQGGFETGPRETVGSHNITNLGAFETDPLTQEPSMKEVCVPWNTTGLGNKPYTYRFYVTVDPDDDVKNEIHEWKDSQGNKLTHGNNEGYWPWGSGIAIAGKAALEALQAEKPGVSLNVGSLAIETDSGLKSKGPVRVFAGKKYRLRAHLVANEHHRGQRYTIFYDGAAKEGKVIAIKTSFGLINGDNYVWADWTPRETGEREIYVDFIEESDEEIKDDAWDSLKVVVREGPISWRDEIIDRLMGVEE